VRSLAARSPGSVLLETARCDEANYKSYLFREPLMELAAKSLSELAEMFSQVEAELAAGRYVAGYVAYECGRYFALGDQDAAHADGLPLAWFGVYDAPVVFDHAAGVFVGESLEQAEDVSVLDAPVAKSDELRLEIAEVEYVAAIERIKRYIEAGDTYQVNFTDAVALRLECDAATAFAALLESQPVSYAAMLQVAGRQVLSLSPELFFRVDGRVDAGEGARRITTRPMKGTMRRGMDVVEDAVQAALLAADEKNRSEHVMIVDLLRNDLGRVCEMGSVAVEDLFTVERYRTLLQMTSTVTGMLRGDAGWHEVFRAVFPSGSITGAPKVRTMQIIEELERGPRGVYTGAIGYFAPDGGAQFNVAIRTLVVEADGAARMGVGGGIVADSVAEAEYRECQLKASFLSQPSARFQLIETMLAEDGVVRLLPLHVERLLASAQYFEFACDTAAVESSVAAYLRENRVGRLRLRLLLDREGAVTLTHVELPAAAPNDVAVCVSPRTVDSRDVFLRHKTTRRALYDEEFAHAREAGFDEAIFLNERGEVTEGAISTVFVERDGVLLTPPLESGVLPGVLRRELLDAGRAQEQLLTLDDLRAAETVYIGNSMRGLRRVVRLEAAERLTASSDEGSALNPTVVQV